MKSHVISFTPVGLDLPTQPRRVPRAPLHTQGQQTGLQGDGCSGKEALPYRDSGKGGLRRKGLGASAGSLCMGVLGEPLALGTHLNPKA